jgi:hypothetical protein
MDSKQINRLNQLLEQNHLSRKQFIISVLENSEGSKNYESQKGNFSKIFAGERKLSDRHIIGVERTLHTSWRYILDGGLADASFEPKGIRYAAYCGTYHDFELLGKEMSNDDQVIHNFDEYDNSLLDYILDYHAIEGLRYLYDNSLIQLGFDLKNLQGPIYSSRRNEEAGKEAFLLICEKDDAALFNGLFNPYKLLNFHEKAETIFDDPAAQKALLAAPKILASLLREKEFSWLELNPWAKGMSGTERKAKACPPLLGNLLVSALHDPVVYQDQLQQILAFGKAYNEKRIAEIDAFNEKEKADLTLEDDGELMMGRLLIGNLFTYRLNEALDLPVGTTRELKEINEQINQVKFQRQPLLGGFSKGNSRVENGQLVKRSTGNADEYACLKEMAANNFALTPRLLKQENGLDYFTYFPGESAYFVSAMPLEKTIQVAKALRAIAEISKKTLGDGRVYVHGDLSPMNAVFHNGTLAGIVDWDSAHIGRAEEDFIYLAWTWLNIGDYMRNNQQILDDLLVLLKAYGADASFKKDFAQKMRNAMDERLARTPKDSPDYARIFQWVGWSKIWVDLLAEDISKKIG